MRTQRRRPLLELRFRPLVSRAVLALLSTSLFMPAILADAPATSEKEPATAPRPKNTVSASPRLSPKASGPAASAVNAVSGRRVALSTVETRTHSTLKSDLSAPPKLKTVTALPPVEEDPAARAIRTIKESQARFASVNDYSCTFYKRERINGRLTPLFVMAMKARSDPRSIYFKFEDPYKGREAIYVEGQNSGKILAHEVGLTRFLTGTLELEPTSARAMENSRHPITDAGIGALIETVCHRWVAELKPEESLVVFDPDMTIGPRRCLMIEAIHPHRQADFQFHKVRLFIDSEHRLPIRFEGYDWPREAGGPAELVEEYSYINLKLNVGLDDRDFDPSNSQYAFGRF